MSQATAYTMAAFVEIYFLVTMEFLLVGLIIPYYFTLFFMFGEHADMGI